MATGILTYKVSIKPRMKWLLVIGSLLHWDWLSNKCFKSELVVSDTVQLES